MSLIGYWKFNEGSGTTAADSSGTGAPSATLQSSAKWGPPIDGGSNSCLAVGDGVTNPTLSYAVIPHFTALDNLGTSGASFTAMAWVYWTGGGNGTRFFMAKVPNSPSPASGWGLGISLYQYNGAIEFDMEMNSTWGVPPAGGSCIGAHTVTPNTWTHVAAVYDQVQHKAFIYLNGVLKDTISSVTHNLGTNTLDMWIGGDLYGERFAGLIAEVKLYSDAQTQTQIQASMNAVTPVNPSFAFPNCYRADTGQYITGSTTVGFPAGDHDFSLSLWTKNLVGGKGATGSPMFCWGDGAVTDGAGVFGVAPAGSRYLTYKVKDNAYVGSTVSIADTNWHHLVVTYNASNHHVKFYVDNVLANTVTSSFVNAITLSSWLIGNFFDHAEPLRALIAGVHFWNVELSAANVSTLDHFGYGITHASGSFPSTGFVDGWELQETSGTTVHSITGSNDGTATIADWVIRSAQAPLPITFGGEQVLTSQMLVTGAGLYTYAQEGGSPAFNQSLFATAGNNP